MTNTQTRILPYVLVSFIILMLVAFILIGIGIIKTISLENACKDEGWDGLKIGGEYSGHCYKQYCPTTEYCQGIVHSPQMIKEMIS